MQDFLIIAQRSPFDLHNDYQRTIIQLCFVLMYSVTWPMCALVCFCFNMARRKVLRTLQTIECRCMSHSHGLDTHYIAQCAPRIV